MFEYKDEQYFNSFFTNLDDFKLVKKFVAKGDKFFGEIEAVNAVHPLFIQVEIPKMFPHKKLMFYTNSLFGYPHLIPTKYEKKNWFCLNTPFSESVEGQLEQEIARLSSWIQKMMRPELPARIEDPEIQRTLSLQNAFGWEIFDSEEFQVTLGLFFVGDFASDAEKFKVEDKKYLFCAGTIGDCDTPPTLYAFEHPFEGNTKIPYIVVDKYPPEDTRHSFTQMTRFYGWSEEITKKLLTLNCTDHVGLAYSFGKHKEISSDELKKNSEKLVEKANIPERYKERAIQELKREHKFSSNLEEDENSWDYSKYNDPDEIVDLFFESHYFALAVKKNNKIEWLLFSSSHNQRVESPSHEYPIVDGVHIHIKQYLDHSLNVYKTSVLPLNRFYGRGAFVKSFSELRIAVVGLGAIGSVLVDSLVRSGVHKLGLWDDDKVEIGNLCRSVYSNTDVGQRKSDVMSSHIAKIAPHTEIKAYGNFYGGINYASQEELQKKMDDYDLIIDCTASNELLHFMSYALPNKKIISLCITNHAQDLLCVSNVDGNPFEIRKSLLAKIEQDTQNFFVEGTGCYSPTFLALKCDISALVNMAVREINLSYRNNEAMHTTVWTYKQQGVVADKLLQYELECGIKLFVTRETLLDGEELPDAPDGLIGYLFGNYSTDGKMIFVTHFVAADRQTEYKLEKAYKQSNGIVDYIGDICYSGASYIMDEKGGKVAIYELIEDKANDPTVNTNNPLLAVRETDGSFSFSLYLNGKLQKFSQVK